MVSVHLIFWALFLYFRGVVEKTIISLALVGCEMIVANSALCAFLATYPVHACKCINAQMKGLCREEDCC